MGKKLDRLTIKGFKSIRELEDFDLRNTNILIGANGAGKSNFVEVFRMLGSMIKHEFANYTKNQGGADDMLFNGPKETGQVILHFVFGSNEYKLTLEPTPKEVFNIANEGLFSVNHMWVTIGSNTKEISLPERKDNPPQHFPQNVSRLFYDIVSSWIVYHFHDTSLRAPMRRSEIVEYNDKLVPDGGNIAPFLLRLRDHHPQEYNNIVEAIRTVTPFFADFTLDPLQLGEKNKVKLSWRQKGSDYPMQPYHLSDGTIRFICLATALLQPYPPSTIVIDEPELGLHPYAIEILAELIKSAAQRTQIVVSTQSTTLVDCFEPEDVIVVNRKDGASTFERLDTEELAEWLQDYSLGELWRKIVVRGGPVYE